MCEEIIGSICGKEPKLPGGFRTTEIKHAPHNGIWLDRFLFSLLCRDTYYVRNTVMAECVYSHCNNGKSKLSTRYEIGGIG